jgi:2-polyprenylphenol hydroxylase and related flavodoxin oxidoreductases
MKKFDDIACKLLKKTEIQPGIFDFVLEAPAFAKITQAGQFAHVRIPGRTLRRPISICGIDREKATIRLVFQIRGKGTEEMSAFKEGEMIEVLAPIGNGFSLHDKSKKALIIGGGIGTPPLLEIAKHYGNNADVILGFRNSDNVILEEEFKGFGAKVSVATEDGSAGTKGYVTNLIQSDKKYDYIYTCGPEAMLKAVCKFAVEKGIFCYISLEERMACGVGACLGCACELIDDTGNKYYGHVCKDGPVFDYKKVAAFAEPAGE